MINENVEKPEAEEKLESSQVEPSQVVEVKEEIVEEVKKEPVETATVQMSDISSSKPKSKQLSNIERYHSLQASFNKSFDDIIKSYLVGTCGYENTANVDKLREKLTKKFVVESNATSIKGEEKFIKGYLKSLLAVFECLYKRYKSGFFIPNPALLNKRIDYLISEISDGNIKKINGKEKEKLCADVIEKVKGGGGKKTKKRRKGSKRRATKKNKSRSRRTRRNK